MNEAPTNEALAAQAKAGDREALAALWEQNRGLLRIMFSRLAAACRERMDAAGVTIEDLEQEGYFAVAKAAKLYDPSAGTKFSTFLFYPVKNAFACAVGLRTERQRQEPLCRCDSLDAPLDAEDDGSATEGTQCRTQQPNRLLTMQTNAYIPHSSTAPLMMPWPCWMNGRPLLCVAGSTRAARWKVWPCSLAYPANVSGKQNQKPFVQCAFHGSSASWKRTGKISSPAAYITAQALQRGKSAAA